MRHLVMLLILATGFLTGCSSPITAENYAKIHIGMPRDQITELLGKPDECSGVTVPILAAEKCTWKSGSRRIVVNFVNHTAIAASAEGL